MVAERDGVADCDPEYVKFVYTVDSVVTVSNILLSVGFGRFCKKNRGFRFDFRFLSIPFSPCRQCGTFMRPTAHQTCSSTLHISVYNSSRHQQVSNSVGLVA